MKKCSKCKVEKEMSDFYLNSKTKDGLKTICKVCHKEDTQKRDWKYKEVRKKYREEHKEEYRAKKKLYYDNNKEKILPIAAQWRQTFKGRLLSYTRSAKQRNIEWLLTEEEFSSFWGKNCVFCNETILTIGIDRKDSEKGYYLENCQSCCSLCNTMKMNTKQSDFINQINKIWEHTQKLKEI